MTESLPSLFSPKAKARLCIVAPYLPSLTETFIRAHVERLPAKTVLVHGWRPSVGERPVLSLPTRVVYKAWRMLSGAELERETTAAYTKAFRRYRAAAALAEYGGTGVEIQDACQRARIPLIVHFHGYDVSVRSVLEEYAETYPVMFRKASAVIAVSRAMEKKLISLGAPPEKVHYNPYGVDCQEFGDANPGSAPPVFIATGRFTEKKAPQLTLAAFAKVYRAFPESRLRMVGDGPLLSACQNLAKELGLEGGVTFLGAQPHSVVKEEVRRARCFVQHSVVAPSGDCEGTPVAIIEAGASGLPVVSTRHGGIPDVVVEGQTGFLVNEQDTQGMSEHMLQLARDASRAAQMGQAARRRIETHFSMENSLSRLWAIIEASIANHRNGQKQGNQLLYSKASGSRPHK